MSQFDKWDLRMLEVLSDKLPPGYKFDTEPLLCGVKLYKGDELIGTYANCGDSIMESHLPEAFHGAWYDYAYSITQTELKKLWDEMYAK